MLELRNVSFGVSEDSGQKEILKNMYHKKDETYCLIKQITDQEFEAKEETYARIEEIISAEETSQKESQLHPYKKHDILVWNPRGPSQCLAAY